MKILNSILGGFSFTERVNQHYTTKKVRWNKCPKKILSEKEIAKRNWREFKKVRKDKAKSYFYLGNKYHLTLGHRKMRRWVKQRINAGDYDLDRRWRKTFIDPWDWH